MPDAVGFENVYAVGLESSPVAEALAGLPNLEKLDLRNRAELIAQAGHALWLLANRPALEPHASEN